MTVATNDADRQVIHRTSAEVVDSLTRARCVLVNEQPFYGHMCMLTEWIPSNMDWIKDEDSKTMGVRILNDLRVQCLYYPPFVSKMTVKELVAIIQHEIEHLVRLHCIRGTTRDPKLFNIACDMAVNGKRDNPKIGLTDSGNKPVIPFKSDIVWCPPHLNDRLSAEEYYDEITKDMKAQRCTCKCNGEGSGGGGEDDDKGNSGKGQGDQGDEGQDGKGKGKGKNKKDGGGGGCPIHDKYGGKSLDDHSIWDQSDASPDEARQRVKDMVSDAVEKSQGNVPGHISELLKKLGKPIVRWRSILRQYLGRHVGNSRKTHNRVNRRLEGDESFGMPGVSHHAASTVNVIVDTSGSVGGKELQQFFAEIDMISARAKVYILQWDHAFQGYGLYRRGAWKNFKVNGRGGTDMAAPVQWLIDNGKVHDCQIMLTDGYCNWHEPCGFPFITCITVRDTSEPTWGHVVRLDINE